MNKILVPIDGSAASEKIAEKGIELAKLYKSDVTFINIVNIPETSSYPRYGYLKNDLNDISEKMKETQSKMLDSYVEKINCTDIKCEKVVTIGQPYEEILKFAEEGNFDLIVMGRRGFSKIRRFYVGSVTQRVISEANCPVVIVHEEV